MPLYIRKSVSVGPFRFNLSKSGLGVSIGVKGFRLGAGPRGADKRFKANPEIPVVLYEQIHFQSATGSTSSSRCQGLERARPWKSPFALWHRSSVRPRPPDNGRSPPSLVRLRPWPGWRRAAPCSGGWRENGAA